MIHAWKVTIKYKLALTLEKLMWDAYKDKRNHTNNILIVLKYEYKHSLCFSRFLLHSINVKDCV